jgi:hypothetical protein
MTGLQVKKEHLYQRCSWIEELSGVSLELESAAFGYILYQDLGQNKLRQIAFGPNKQSMYAILSAMYELCLAMQQKEKLKRESVTTTNIE